MVIYRWFWFFLAGSAAKQERPNHRISILSILVLLLISLFWVLGSLGETWLKPNEEMFASHKKTIALIMISIFC